MAQHNLSGTAFPSGLINTATNSMLGAQAVENTRRVTVGPTKRIFAAHIEVMQVTNGYLVNIGKHEGYEHEVHIAATIAEVNDIIAAQMVAFRLEDKT
jgi:hypothetical protein